MVEGKQKHFNQIQANIHHIRYTKHEKGWFAGLLYVFPLNITQTTVNDLNTFTFSQKLDVQNFPRRGHEPRNFDEKKRWNKNIAGVATFRDRAILRDHQVQVATQCIDLSGKGKKKCRGFLGWRFITPRIQIYELRTKPLVISIILVG